MESKSGVSNAQKTPRKTSEVETTQMILVTLGDTTWRMFVPSIGFTLLGVWLDGQFGTKPWLMTSGIILGLAGAVLLVRKQLSDLKSRKELKK
jgi:hypothetical protein